MTAERQEGHAQRSLLFLAIFAGSLGSCGACNAVGQYNDLPYVAADSSLSAEVAEGQQAIKHIAWNNPHRQGLAIGGFIVSLMLMIGCGLLLRSRKSAVWWVRNSIAANLVWTGLHAASNYFHIRNSAPQIREVIRSIETSEEWTQGPSAIANHLLFGDALHAAVLLYLLWRLAQDSAPRKPEKA